jgi:hypothetical protein
VPDFEGEKATFGHNTKVKFRKKKKKKAQNK